METICQCDSISYTSLQFWYPQSPGTPSPVDSKGTTVLEPISIYLHTKIRAKDGVLWNKNVSHFGGEETERERMDSQFPGELYDIFRIPF